MHTLIISRLKTSLGALAISGIVMTTPPAFAQTTPGNASLPAYLDVIKTARVIQDTRRLKEGADGADVIAAFQKAIEAGEGIRTDLKWLSENATPAGKIYAALLLNRIDSEAGIKTLNRMKSDKDIVVYKKGNESVHYTVGEVAIDLLSENPSILIDPQTP